MSRRRRREWQRLQRDARYIVRVDDNGRFMDEESRYTVGLFLTCDDAVGACQRMVDAYLEEAFRPGMTAEVLVASYRSFGDDPFVVPLAGAPSCEFSAWRYADGRARAMCARSLSM